MAPADALSAPGALALHGAGPRSAPAAGLTVHVVGRLTVPVLSFLLPTVQALAAVGTPQAVVYVDDEVGREHVPGLPDVVRRVPVPDSSSRWGRSRSLYHALSSLAADEPPAVLHLHGLLPGLAAMRLLRDSGDRSVRVYLSPHWTGPLLRARPLRALIGWLMQMGLGHCAPQVIVNLRAETRLASPIAGVAVELIECPVPGVFFDTPVREALRPLLVSCNLSGPRAAVDRFVRIAVLLGDERLGFGFNWVGRAQPEAAAAMRAAGIGQFESSTDESRAVRLGAAWVYVATCDEDGFPIRLAEAMAVGLACVALDTEVHRSVIVDGVTGYLCADLGQFLQRIGSLVDSPALRRQIGQAAQQVALQRFGEDGFRHRLWQAIGTGAPTPGATP
ncbi:glycosyltransferase [Ideonella sp. A 288]|uniref:glycosyltransferase n=1 Tax=Ideonella sp. A 288 TaxID=1962181 RepID=UPI000B4B32E1|nr:glycosyltransferase [Ideonella sp. A 288]